MRRSTSRGDEYATYDYYDAINLDRTAEIPMDYDGAMGVPIAFPDRHNADQFEITGMDRSLIAAATGTQSRFKLNERVIYARIVIHRKDTEA